MANSLVTGLRTLFAVLCCAMVATLIFTIFVDGLPFRKELLTPWMAATLVDFYINVVPLAGWVLYKESTWLSAILWIILLVCFGSITTCAYILMQFLKLSPQESLQDPMYYVLLRHTDKVNMEQKRKHSSVVTLRILFVALGCLMTGTLLYTLLTDGSPFRKELFTPWMQATLIDFYINVVALSLQSGVHESTIKVKRIPITMMDKLKVNLHVWVYYKESNWISAIFWVILLISFGSITTCVYIAWKLFQLSPQDPAYLVLLSSGSRAENRYNGLHAETVQR